MASSRKRRSRERKEQKSLNRSNDNLEGTRAGKKKSNRGCFGGKRRRSSYEYQSNDAGNKTIVNTHTDDETDNSYRRYQTSGHNHAEANHPLPTHDRNYHYDVTDNNGRGEVKHALGREHELEVNTGNASRKNHVDITEHYERNTTGHTNRNSSPISRGKDYSYHDQGGVGDAKMSQNGTSYSYEYQTSAANKPTHNVEEIFEERVITRGANINNPVATQSYAMTKTDKQQLTKHKRSSIISKVSSSFSSHSSVRKSHLRKGQTYSTSAVNNLGKRVEAHISVDRKLRSLDNMKSVHNESGAIPILKTNKSYNISFAMNLKDFTDSSATRNENRTIESMETTRGKDLMRKRSSKRIQTDEAYLKGGVQHSADGFRNLMKDVPYHENKALRSSEAIRRSMELRQRNGLNSPETAANNNAAGEWKSDWKREWKEESSSGMHQGKHDVPDSIHTTEHATYKEWMIVEHPDGRQEKREYRRETNADGDVNYVDLVSGNILKTDKASWKNGEELVKTKKGSKMIRYEWRKDLETNEWIKYNTDTNEILKKGDWKTGSEWYRNPKGKLSERSYVYKRNADGQWLKSDSRSGMIIDNSHCSALKGYNWIPSKKGGKSKNKIWKKQNYEYVQDKKGKWIKQDPITKRKLSKPSRTGWKQGLDYHMNKDGKVRRVRYMWQTETNGEMHKVNKKTKEPINTMWMRGREIIMQDNKVVTNNYCWVNNGKNKWVKIDEETGKPLTNNINSNKIASYNQSESQSKTNVMKTSRRIDNNKIIEENTTIEQSGGGVVKNTTKTIKY